MNAVTWIVYIFYAFHVKWQGQGKHRQSISAPSGSINIETWLAGVRALMMRRRRVTYNTYYRFNVNSDFNRGFHTKMCTCKQALVIQIENAKVVDQDARLTSGPMFALTCDFHENLWECLICWIWTVIKSNRKRLQLAQAHELHHISSTTCQSREHWETSRDWKSKQTLNCSVPFCVKFFADGDEDLGTWHMVSNWHLTRIVNNYCPTDALVSVWTNTEALKLG